VYAPQQYLGHATIFKTSALSYRPSLDWRALITGGVEIHEAAADHMDLTKEPLVAMWAARLKETLDRSDPKE